MRCLSAVLALLLATLVWLPSAGFARDDLAISHPPNWDQSLAITHATGNPVGEMEQTKDSAADDGEPGESLDRYAQAHSNGGGAMSAPAPDLPLAITTFQTSE